MTQSLQINPARHAYICSSASLRRASDNAAGLTVRPHASKQDAILFVVPSVGLVRSIFDLLQRSESERSSGIAARTLRWGRKPADRTGFTSADILVARIQHLCIFHGLGGERNTDDLNPERRLFSLHTVCLLPGSAAGSCRHYQPQQHIDQLGRDRSRQRNSQPDHHQAERGKLRSGDPRESHRGSWRQVSSDRNFYAVSFLNRRSLQRLFK